MECLRAQLFVAAPHEGRQSSRSESGLAIGFAVCAGATRKHSSAPATPSLTSSDARRIDEMRPERNRTWSASG